MRKIAGVAVMIGAALAASCKSDNDRVATRPTAQPTNAIFFLGEGMGLNTLMAARRASPSDSSRWQIPLMVESASLDGYRSYRMEELLRKRPSRLP